MNIAVLKKAGIDYEAGLRRFLDDSDLYETVLTAFLQDQSLEKAEVAYAAGDNDALFEIAHELKGSCGNTDMTVVYKAACELTEKLRHNRAISKSELADTYQAFKSAYLAARNGIALAQED
ncbi:MAG: Hpt domain-containing protein [Eubacteriales bacterium]|nr:Hpt domain-containing protein [Eubacteriales bacterium]